jgi:hypothetical protein
MNCPNCGSGKTHKNGTGSYTDGRKYQKLKCLDCGKDTVIPIGETAEKVIETDSSKLKIGITLNDFRKRHDVLFIVTGVIKSLNGDLLYEKADICKLCKVNITTPGLTSIIQDHKDFEEYRGRTHGKYYWGKPEIIKKLKEEGLLT